MKLACVIVAIVLFAISAIPNLPYSSTLRGIGLAFFAGSTIVA